MKYIDQTLKDNRARQRFELEVEGVITFIDYKKSPENLFLVHTEVPAVLEGKGVGSAMVQKAFQYAEANKLKIVPLCSFVQLYLKRHNEWAYLVAPDTDRYIDQ